MEVCVIALLAGAGYVATRLRQQQPPVAQQDSSYSQDAGLGIVAVDAGDRPSSTGGIYESRRLDQVRSDETWRATDMARRALDPAHGSPAVVARYDREAPPRGRADPFAKPASPTVHSQLLGQDVPVEQFKHNNMVPFYGGKVKQPSVDQTNYSAGKLEAFTGAYEHRPLGRKKEIEAIWSPTPQGVMNSAGRSIMDESREAWMQTMPQSRNRANEAPAGLAPEIVGRPGIRGGKTGDVYFDMREHAYNPNVDELRPASRPKLSFEGRILPGSTIAPDLIADLARELPNIRERTKEPLMEELTCTDQLFRTVGAYTAPIQRPDNMHDLKCTERQSTSQNSYVGGAHVKIQAGDYGKSSILVYGNNRDVTTIRSHKGNLVSAVKAIVAPLQDAVRVTKKEEAHAVDAPRAFGNAGAAQGVPKLTVYDADDVARTTLKQMIIAESQNLNFVSARKVSVVYDPDDVARTSRKETLLAETSLGNLRGVNTAGVVYDEGYMARTTLKEQLVNDADPNRNFHGNTVHTVYNVDEWTPQSTKKEMLAERATPYGSAGGLQGRAVGAYATTDATAKTTTRETTVDNGTAYGMADATGRVGGYETAPRDVKTTTKETTVDHDYFGGGTGEARPKSHDAEQSMQILGARGELEAALDGRPPTLSSVKIAAALGEMGEVQTVSSGGLAQDTRAPIRAYGAGGPRAPDEFHLGVVSNPRRDGSMPFVTVGADRLAAEAAAGSAQRAGNPFVLST
jgi:hypothetical protein